MSKNSGMRRNNVIEWQRREWEQIKVKWKETLESIVEKLMDT